MSVVFFEFFVASLGFEIVDDLGDLAMWLAGQAASGGETSYAADHRFRSAAQDRQQSTPREFFAYFRAVAENAGRSSRNKAATTSSAVRT